MSIIDAAERLARELWRWWNGRAQPEAPTPDDTPPEVPPPGGWIEVEEPPSR